MAGLPTVLVLTHDEDRTAERVTAELAARGVRVAQLDAAGVPTRVALAAASEVVFLEVNQAGEWGWLAAECDLPIAAALADVLQAGCV